GALRLSFDPDLLNLIPQQNKQVNDFRKVLRDLGTIDYHIVILEIPRGRDVHEYDPLIQAIAEGYRKSPRIEDVSYQIPNPLDFIQIILPKAMLFLTPAELDEVALKLSDAGIREAVARNRTLLQTPQASVMKQVIQYDPFNLLPIFLRKFQSAGGGFNIVGSVIGVLGLFIYAFRRAASVVYAGAPLALGLLLTFGTAGVLYGTLSQASAGFAALLAGLGIDFITVMYGRYVDERNRGS